MLENLRVIPTNSKSTTLRRSLKVKHYKEEHPSPGTLHCTHF